MNKNLLTGLLVSALFSCANGMSAQKIAVLSDIHVTPGNANETELRKAVDEINSDSSLNLVVVCGDLTNEGSDVQLKNVKSILDNIRIPQYVIPGNHEDTWSQSATKTFIDLWGNDRFVAETDKYVLVGTNCGPYMKMGDGHVKQEDLHWLRSTLSSRMDGKKRVISFNHYPLRKDDLDNYKDYISILEDFPTVIHINGHYHKYEPYMSGKIPSMMVRALDNKKDYGYTILDFGTDSVYIYNKVIGNKPERIHSYKISIPDGKTYASEIGRNAVQPDGFELTKVYEDTASIFTRLGFSPDKVFFGNSLGYVNCVSKEESEKPVWSFRTGASLFGRPVYAGNGMLFVPSADRRMIVLNSSDGKLLRENAAPGPYMADGIKDGDNIYVGGYKRFECLDAKTGDIKWVFDSINNYCQASPVVDGEDVVFGAWDTNLRSLSKNSGKLNWKWNNGKTANMLGPGNVVPLVTDSIVIVVAPDRYMTAIDRKTGATLWRDNSVKYRESLGISEDKKKAYAKTMDGELVCVEIRPDRHNFLWKTDLTLGYEHAPCIVAERNGIVYAGSRRGIVCAVDAATSKLLWTSEIGSSEINGIDLDPYSDDVYVSLVEGTVWRIRKK